MAQLDRWPGSGAEANPQYREFAEGVEMTSLVGVVSPVNVAYTMHLTQHQRGTGTKRWQEQGSQNKQRRASGRTAVGGVGNVGQASTRKRSASGETGSASPRTHEADDATRRRFVRHRTSPASVRV